MRFWLPTLAYLALTVYAIVDIAQRPDPEPYRLAKPVWILIVLFAPYVGALAWIVARYINGPSPAPRYDAPMGPDDDPAYRIWLAERERRRRQQGGRE